MLGVGLRQLCLQDSFGYAFREKKIVRKSTPGGCKIGPRGVQNGLREASDGSFAPVKPNLAAKAARKPCSNGSGGALGALLALLEPSWGLLGRSWGVLGRSWAPLEGRFWPSRELIWTIWTMSVALREIQQKPCILQCFWASRACRRGPKSLQNRPGRSRGTKDRSGGPKLRYTRAKLSYIRRFWTPCRGIQGLARHKTSRDSSHGRLK